MNDATLITDIIKTSGVTGILGYVLFLLYKLLNKKVEAQDTQMKEQQGTLTAHGSAIVQLTESVNTLTITVQMSQRDADKRTAHIETIINKMSDVVDDVRSTMNVQAKVVERMLDTNAELKSHNTELREIISTGKDRRGTDVGGEVVPLREVK